MMNMMFVMDLDITGIGLCSEHSSTLPTQTIMTIQVAIAVMPVSLAITVKNTPVSVYSSEHIVHRASM